jgi:hypothetical protein
MNADAARQALMRVWNYPCRARIRDRGRLWRREAKGRAEAEEAATTREGQTSRVVDHRRPFWTEFREGQQQADASCLDSDRVLNKTDDRVKNRE